MLFVVMYNVPTLNKIYLLTMCIYGLDFRHEKYYIVLNKISFI